MTLRNLFALTSLVTAVPVAAGNLTYPDTRRGDQVDTLHGVAVPDPYRWLEQDVREAPEVAAWVEAQNRVTFGVLDKLPARPAIEQRLTTLWNYAKYSTPTKAGGRYFFYRNDGLQNQSVLYRLDSLDGEARILIDPNTWSKDGTVALAGTSFSDDGRYLAYGLAEAGSDWRTYRIMQVDGGKVLDDELRWVKFSGLAWTPDSKGFFYGRFDPPTDGDEFQGLNLHQKLYYHRVGTPQADDVLVHQEPDHPEWGFGAEVSEDGRYLILTVWKGTDDRYRVLVRDLTEPYAMPAPLFDTFDNEWSFVGNDGHVFYFKTDLEAPNGRVVSIDIRHQDQGVQEIVPQRDQPLTSVSLVANLLAAQYLEDATSRIELFDLDGRRVREVELPGIGSVDGFGGRRSDTETFYEFSNFATPPAVYRYDMITGTSSLFRTAKVEFDPEAYTVRQVFFTSKDGTRVPMFVSHRKDLELDGTHPTLLYGYGGFKISLTPDFSVAKLLWMEMGGVYAVANLRGGGEYGDAWHKAGTKLSKQNVFDDFIGAAEWLIGNRYTRPDRLAIQGGSNGGLLVGAVMIQRPELFGACLPAVGVMDMLRFHKFTAGRFWVDDYGSADDAEEFAALLAYSPYHNLKQGVAYPATLVTTADTDDRVVPGHSFKFAAALQRAHKGDAPVLIRIESRAGHGAGTPTSKRIRRAADEYAFLAEQLGGLDLPEPTRTESKSTGRRDKQIRQKPRESADTRP